MRNVVIAASVLLAAATASAQPAMTPPTAPMYEIKGPSPELKSESTGTALAIGATLAGLALTSAGVEHEEGSVVFGGIALMLIGPSAGHFYAGETGHAAKMSLLRTGGLLVLGIGVISASSTYLCAASEDGTGGCPQPDHSKAEKMMWIGGATLLGATLYDLWDAHNAVHRANEKAARSTWTVAPSLMAGASGTKIPALTLGGSF